MNHPRRYLWLAALLAFVVYVPALGNGFALDDTYIAKAYRQPGVPNDLVRELQPLSSYFTTRYWHGVEEGSPLYRPVSVLSYAVVYRWFGRHMGDAGEGMPQHLLNLLLNVACVFLVYLLLRPVTSAGLAAVLGAAVFGLHALHSEVVASVVGRADLLTLVFGAGALLAHVQWQRAPGGVRWVWLGATGLLLFLALGAKESAIAWPAFFVAYGIASADAGERTWRRALAEARASLVASLAPLLLYFGLRAAALSGMPEAPEVDWAVNPLVTADLGVRSMTAVMVCGFGLLKVIVPFWPVSDYGAQVFRLVESPGDVRFAGALVALAAVSVGGLLMLRRQPLLFLAGTAFLGFSFVTSNLAFPIGTIFAERLYFLASLGLSFVVAWGFERAGGSTARLSVIGVTVVWIAASCVAIVPRASVWKDDDTLSRHDAGIQPRSLLLRYNAALSHRRAGDQAGFERHLRAALEVEPEFATALSELATAHIGRGEWRQAEELIAKGLGARRLNRERDLPRLHFNMGIVQLRRSRIAEALEHFESSLRADPVEFTRELSKFAAATRQLVRPERLLAFFDLGLELIPRERHWMLQRGIVLARIGRFDAAIESLESPVGVLLDDPDRPLGALSLARSYARTGRRVDAANTLERLLASRRAPSDVRVSAEQLLRTLRRRE